MYTRREKESMDHRMGENSGGNGILMEDEIFGTPSVDVQPQAVPSQAIQPQPGMSSQYNTMAQSGVSSQYAAVTPSQSGVQPQQMAPSPQSDELAAFHNAPSFDAMDGMDMGVSGAGGNGAFGDSSNTASDWQNQNSDMAFQGSSAGRAMSDQVVMYEKTPSNMILGIVGALIGALIGAALWFGIYQLGYIAGIAGAAIIGFSIKGYVILGRSIDIKGLVLCAVLSIVTIYFSHRAAFAFSYMRTMNETLGSHMSFITAYTNLDKFMKTMDAASQALGVGDSVTVAYWRDLFVGYALSAVVGIPMARKMIDHS